MVTLVVATTVDPASIGPASALLAMPGWIPSPSWQEDAQSFVNREVRLVKLDYRLVTEDNLDKGWEETTGESVDEVIFLSKHAVSSNWPALTIHPIGTPHISEGEALVAGGKPGWAAPPNPRIGPWLRLLSTIAASLNLTPEFEVTLEATHHGPVVNSPTMFVEIGSTEEYWGRQDAAHCFSGWCGKDWGLEEKVLWETGIGGHYVPRHMDIVLKDDIWVGHLLSGYSLPMEDPSRKKEKANAEAVDGTWREAIKVAFEATKLAFPGGQVIAHLDHKSFKS